MLHIEQEYTMIVKIVIILLLVAIITSLAFGMTYLIKDDSKTDRVVKSLTFRIGLSLLVFVFLFVSYHMGWIQPHGVGR